MEIRIKIKKELEDKITQLRANNIDISELFNNMLDLIVIPHPKDKNKKNQL